MPLRAYTFVHSGAKLSPADIEILKNIRFPHPRKTTDTSQIRIANEEYTDFIKGNLAVNNVKPAPNGMNYIPGYRRCWKVISTSDRFDNGTMRIIFANDIAVKAIQEHKTKNWPDGAVFCQGCLKQQVNANGTITTGAFWQVEFMIKDAGSMPKTAGWGWARWRGNKAETLW